MSLTWLDLMVVAMVGVGALRGLKRGLVREGMAFAGLAAGLVLATQWHQEVAGLLRPFIGGGRLADALAYLGVMLVALGCATLLTVVLLRLARLLLVGWLDGLGGVLFGAGQGAVLAALALFLLLEYQVMGLDETVRSSDLSVELLRAVASALAHLPPELASIVELLQVPAAP